MALSVKDSETDRLAREAARLTGESPTEAVRKALAERPERERLGRGKPRKGVAEQLYALRCPILTHARLTKPSVVMKMGCGDGYRLLGYHCHPVRRKGRHPVSVNIGDCFAYVLAKTTGFARTDIASLA